MRGAGRFDRAVRLLNLPSPHFKPAEFTVTPASDTGVSGRVPSPVSLDDDVPCYHYPEPPPLSTLTARYLTRGCVWCASDVPFVTRTRGGCGEGSPRRL